jgi:hypothetical protein
MDGDVGSTSFDVPHNLHKRPRHHCRRARTRPNVSSRSSVSARHVLCGRIEISSHPPHTLWQKLAVTIITMTLSKKLRRIHTLFVSVDEPGISPTK